nr:hypothetical protein [Pseudonocardia nigra]
MPHAAQAAAFGDVAVVEHVPADLGEGFGLPLRHHAVIVGARRLGLRVAQSGDVVDSAGSSNRPFTVPPGRPVCRVIVSSLVRAGGVVVGFGAVLVELVDEVGAPGVQLGGGVLGGSLGEDRFGVGEPVGVDAFGGGRCHECGDDLDVPQSDGACGEGGRGGGQPGRQGGAVEVGPCADLVGGGNPAAGFEPLPAQQVGQCGGGVLVAAVGERARRCITATVSTVTRSSPRAVPSHIVSTDTSSSSVVAGLSATARTASSASASRRCAWVSGLPDMSPFYSNKRSIGSFCRR